MLSIKNLSVAYNNNGQQIPAVENISIEIEKGEFAGLVGESGSGKTTIANTILNLLPDSAKITGDLAFTEHEMNTKTLNKFRKDKVSYIGQNFYKSLSQYFTLESHYRFFFKSIFKRNATQADFAEFIELLKLLKLDNPAEMLKCHPFMLSGGMRQRVAIAFSLLKKPDLLIADEPTSAIDMRAKEKFIELIKSISNQNDMSVLMISHDLNLIFDFCDSVYVLFKGKIVEQGKTDEIRKHTAHPYTKLLVNIEESDDILKNNNAIQEHKSCAFSIHCRKFTENCSDKITKLSSHHFAACSEVEKC